jgi:acetyltransferase
LIKSGAEVPEDVEAISFQGRALSLRPLQSHDRALLEDLVARTELHDLQLRFFGALRSLSPGLLDHLMRIDPASRVTVVASRTTAEGEPEILAVGRAHVLTHGKAELAILVRSDLKGLGLGSMLLDTLIAQCHNRGISILLADVLPQNARMLRLAQKYGFRAETVHSGITRLVLELGSLAA